MLYQQAADARLEAEEANRLKSMFLSNVSHELRTPLSIIVARTEMLKQELAAYQPALPESIYNELEIIGMTSRQLGSLAWGRPGSGARAGGEIGYYTRFLFLWIR